MTVNDENVVRIDLLRINKNSKKICQCKNPKYEIDIKNRMIQCTSCNAYVDPFEALESIANRYEQFEACQEKAIERIKWLQEEIKVNNRKRLKTQIFKDIETSYLKNDLFPRCPICKKAFNPNKIDSYTNKNYIQEE